MDGAQCPLRGGHRRGPAADVAKDNDYRVVVSGATTRGVSCADFSTAGMRVEPMRVNLLLKLSCPGAPAPRATVEPSVTGDWQLGEKLTATHGTWDHDIAPVGEIAWFRGEQQVATGANYVVTADDLDQDLTARFTQQRVDYVQDTDGERSLVTFAPFTFDVTQRVAKGTLSRTGEVTIVGGKKVGEELEITGRPVWTPGSPGTAVDIEWLRGDTPIAGAEGETYTLVGADADKVIRVRLTASREHYDNDVVVHEVGTIARGTLTATAATVTGVAQAGRTLTAGGAAFTPTATPSYQWLVDGGVVPGATGKTFTVPLAYGGRTVAVRVTGRLAGYDDLVAPAAKAVAIPAVLVKKPRVKGNFRSARRSGPRPAPGMPRGTRSATSGWPTARWSRRRPSPP